MVSIAQRNSKRDVVVPVLAAVAVAVYANTLHAGFCFDDNFAILNNGDVIHADASYYAMLFHDFWGQNISKPDSHKSYRYVFSPQTLCSHMPKCHVDVFPEVIEF